MNPLDTHIVDLARDVLLTTLFVAGPILLVGLIVGLTVSVFQALTSVQEQSLAQVPKMLAVMGVSLILLAPALQLLRDYALRVFSDLHTFGLS